jgi:hypothetical protein
MFSNSLRTLFILWFFLGAIFSAGAKTREGIRLYLDKSDPEYGLIQSMIFPRGSPKSLELEPFAQADSILVLSDGFKKNSKNTAEHFAKNLPRAQVYKTDIECPPYLDQGYAGNLHYGKLDNNDPFPFKDQSFDIISMSYGLCHCQKSSTTCGGIDLSYKSSSQPTCFSFLWDLLISLGEQHNNPSLFFSEVARVLNQNNPHAVAFLGGPHTGDFLRGLHSERIRHSERDAIRTLQDLIPQLEVQFPSLDWSLVYFENVFQGVYIRLRPKNEPILEL